MNEIGPQPFDILDYWPGVLVVSQRVPVPSATREEKRLLPAPVSISPWSVVSTISISPWPGVAIVSVPSISIGISIGIRSRLGWLVSGPLLASPVAISPRSIVSTITISQSPSSIATPIAVVSVSIGVGTSSSYFIVSGPLLSSPVSISPWSVVSAISISPWSGITIVTIPSIGISISIGIRSRFGWLVNGPLFASPVAISPWSVISTITISQAISIVAIPSISISISVSIGSSSSFFVS